MADTTPAQESFPVVDGIERFPIDSSNLISIGYDYVRRVLAVRFKSGPIFHYSAVDAGTWERFHESPSKGSFFYHHVKGRFAGEKMTGPCGKCGEHGPIGMKCTDCGCDTYHREERRYADTEQTTGGRADASD